MTARIVSGERVEPGPGFARGGAFVAGLDRSPKSSRSAKRSKRPPRRSKADAKGTGRRKLPSQRAIAASSAA
jgi:hypothetical protein